MNKFWILKVVLNEKKIKIKIGSNETLKKQIKNIFLFGYYFHKIEEEKKMLIAVFSSSI